MVYECFVNAAIDVSKVSLCGIILFITDNLVFVEKSMSLEMALSIIHCELTTD